MNYIESITLIDALNDKLRKVHPGWYAWESLPNDWEHVILLARALDIEVPEPTPPFRQDVSRIELVIEKLRAAVKNNPGLGNNFALGQVNALEWVLGRQNEPDR